MGVVLKITLVFNSPTTKGLWKVPCVQLPQWSQEALPDDLWLASTDSPALRHEQRVLLNAGSSDGGFEKSKLSNIFCTGCWQFFFNICSLFKTHTDLAFRKYALILTPHSFLLPFRVFLETPLRPPGIRASHWDSDAGWWPKGHYGPQHRWVSQQLQGISMLKGALYKYIYIYIVKGMWSQS